MASKSDKSLKLKLVFPQKVLGDPIIHKLSHDLGVVPNILRGRITDKNAWLEIEFVGPAKSLEKAVKYLEERNVTITEI